MSSYKMVGPDNWNWTEIEILFKKVMSEHHCNIGVTSKTFHKIEVSRQQFLGCYNIREDIFRILDANATGWRQVDVKVEQNQNLPIFC